jgi:Secretion system C-terminal sorting domain
MKNLFTLTFLFVMGITIRAQQIPYVVTGFNDPYEDITEPISISNGEVWDDPQYFANIGFNFQMIDKVFQNVAIVLPGAQVVSADIMEDSVALMGPYMSDIMDAGVLLDSSISPISYAIEGQAGSRIFKLEWKNVGFYNEFDAGGQMGNRISFQMWLYEGTNVIEYRYGPNSIKDESLVHDFGVPFIVLGQGVAINASSWEGLWIIGGTDSAPEATAWTDPSSNPDIALFPDFEFPSGTVIRFAPTFVNIMEDNKPAFAIFPNPVNDNLNISWNSSKAQAQIFDITGKEVSSLILQRGVQQINVADLSTGSYVLRVIDGNKVYTHHLIKK